MAIDSESAYEVLQQRMRSGVADGPLAPPHSPGEPEEALPSGGLGAVLGGLSDMLGGIFGTSRPRGKRLSAGQVVAREVTRSVTNRVAGQIAADIGKIARGQDGQFGRPRHRARDHGRHLAAMTGPAGRSHR